MSKPSVRAEHQATIRLNYEVYLSRQTQWHILLYPNRARTIPGFVPMALMISKPTNTAGDAVYFHDSVSVAGTTIQPMFILVIIYPVHRRHLAATFAQTHSDASNLWAVVLLSCYELLKVQARGLRRGLKMTGGRGGFFHQQQWQETSASVLGSVQSPIDSSRQPETHPGPSWLK